MNFFTNTKIFKKIVIAILLVMIFNFVSPFCSIVRANALTKILAGFGGALLGPICDLFLAIGDWMISAMQRWFFGTIRTNLENNPGGVENIPKVNIHYGPGVIFANEVPSFDVNFFNPMSTDKELKHREGMVPKFTLCRSQKWGDSADELNQTMLERIGKPDGSRCWVDEGCDPLPEKHFIVPANGVDDENGPISLDSDGLVEVEKALRWTGNCEGSDLEKESVTAAGLTDSVINEIAKLAFVPGEISGNLSTPGYQRSPSLYKGRKSSKLK